MNLSRTSAKSSQVNTLPKAKSQAKDKRANDRQKYAALRCKVLRVLTYQDIRGIIFTLERLKTRPLKKYAVYTFQVKLILSPKQRAYLSPRYITPSRPL
jgi:hypothetical protein